VHRAAPVVDVPALHPDGHRALLYIAASSTTRTASGVAELVDHATARGIAYSVGVLHRSTFRVLQAVRVTVPGVLGSGLAVLPRQVPPQPPRSFRTRRRVLDREEPPGHSIKQPVGSSCLRPGSTLWNTATA